MAADTPGPTPGVDSGGKPNANDTNTKTYQKYDYNEKDTSPFRVIVQLCDDNGGKLRINKLSLGKLMTKVDVYKNNITNIRPLGRNKLLVFLKSFQAANRMQDDTILRNNNYKAFIPRSFVSVTGVVAGVPVDMSIEEVMENISSPCPILAINRLHRYEEGKKVEAHRISITFRASTLPAEVRLFCCINTVRPFVNKPVLCLNCLRYNHTADSCRSKKRCQNCTQQHEREDEVCPNKTKCLYCKEDANHTTVDDQCAEKKRQRNIKTIMAKTTLTYMEAKERFPIFTENRYELLENSGDFPDLTPPKTFAEMSAGQFKTKNPQQYRPQKPKRPNAEVNIADQVQVFADKKKQKKKDDRDEEKKGVALFNTFKTSEFERWARHVEEQRKAQLMQDFHNFNVGCQRAEVGATSMSYYSRNQQATLNPMESTRDRSRSPTGSFSSNM